MLGDPLVAKQPFIDRLVHSFPIIECFSSTHAPRGRDFFVAWVSDPSPVRLEAANAYNSKL